MKKPIIITISATLLLAIALSVYLLGGCQKNVEPINLAIYYFVTGKVVNDETSTPMSGVTVTCLEKSVTTNSDGIYSFNLEELPEDYIKISAKKNGYPIGTTIVSSGNYSSVNTIRLIPPAVSKTIGTSGGSLFSGNTESIDPDQEIEIVFPEGAVSSSTEISMTPLEGVEVPDISPRKTLGLLNAATVSLEPSGLVLNKNATISFPLPMRMDKGQELDVLIYNEVSMEWEKSGVIAIVDSTRSLAISEISHFSTYSIGIDGDYTENVDNAFLYDDPIIPDEDSLYCYQATVVYPDGVPDDVSLNWMKNAVSQNTELGGRVSFFNPTCIPIRSITSMEREPVPDIDCECPDPGDKPCEECGLEMYPFECEKEIDESLKIKYIRDGWEFERRVSNRVTVRKVIQCERWSCPEACHEGGVGN